MQEKSSFLKRLKKVIASFDRVRIGVIGDFVLDLYVYSLATRVSREAPVLILRYEGEKIALGGGANALNNVKSLGACAVPLGFLGDDNEGKKLVAAMEERGIPTHGIVLIPERRTVTKTRILAGSHHTVKQQVLRIDKEPEDKVPNEYRKKLLEKVKEALPHLDAVIISDYGYGTVDDALLELLSRWNGIVTVDSRYEVLRFRKMTACTPNEPEAADALGIDCITDDNIIDAGRRLLELTGNQAVLITRGRKGMALFERGEQPKFIDIYGTDEVADVTGAGDTVIATFTCALAAGAGFYEAARLANYAGGIVVMKMGTATVSCQELLEAVEDDLS